MYAARVLVVDDSPTMRQFVIFALQRLPGLQIDEAEDGVSALKKLAEKKYQLLLTDLHMPLLDGLRLIGLLRNDLSYKSLPIVVITTENSQLTRQKALAAGADEYLTKPLQTAGLINVVRKLLDPEKRRP